MEYVRLILCRDVYHCRPSELRQEKLVDVMDDLECLSAEGRVAKFRAKKAKGG